MSLNISCDTVFGFVCFVHLILPSLTEFQFPLVGGGRETKGVLVKDVR